MSNNIENITDYQKGNTIIAGNFLISNGAGVTCAFNSISLNPVISLIDEPTSPSTPPPLPPVYGCTDPTAANYNPLATNDDGSCFYPVPGCTDPNATNYNPSANVSDGSCIYTYIGVLDAYIGFTSATGAYDEYHVINNLKFTNDIMTLDYSNGFDNKFSYNGTSYLDLVGNSVPGSSPKAAVMTNPTGDGSMFYMPGVRFRNTVKESAHNFSVFYKFTITPADTSTVADGIVFTIQSQSYGVGGGGYGIGYDGISNSVGVKYDTFDNQYPEIEENPSLNIPGYPSNVMTSNYVGLVENGNIYSHGYSYVRCLDNPSEPLLLSDGRPTYNWVDYINGYWYVYISKSSIKPANPIINGYYMPLVNNIFNS